MNLLKAYFICILLIPFITHAIGFKEYFLQTEDYFPVFINGFFSIILILKQQKNIPIPAIKWVAGIIGLLFFLGLIKNGFVNQSFFIKSTLTYIIVTLLFINHYSNQRLFKKDKLQLLVIFILFAFIHIVTGYLTSYFHLKDSLPIGFKHKLLGVFYNPSFLINTLILICPLFILFINLRKSTNRRAKILGWFCLSSLFLIFIIILYNKNRTGLVALTVLVAFNFYLDYYKNFNKKVLIITMALASICLFWVYANKKDSTQGRFLITKVTWVMIKENPLFGVGFNNYKAQYNQYQKKYFKTQGTEKEILLADDNRLAHNEFLQLIAEIGFIGIGVLLFFIYKIFKVYSNFITHRNSTTSLLIRARNGFLLMVLILALFSNPFRIPVLFNLISALFLFFTIAIPFRIEISFMTSHFSKKTLIIFVGLFTIPLLFQEYYLYKWMLHTTKIPKGEKENFSYFNKELNDNENYLFTTSSELYRLGEFKNSIKQLENLKKIKNNSQSEILFGLNYSKLEQHDKAIEYFQSANLMNPKLFRPKHLLMNEYLAKGDTTSAVKEAKKIISFPVKIPSNEVDYYMAEARLVTYLK
jgi:O-antigen ligase